MTDVTGKTVVVVGLGKSGAAAALFLKRRGAMVTLTDMAESRNIDEILLSEVETAGVSMELGGHKEETFLTADFIVISPGVPLSITPVKKALSRNIPVIGEIELAARFLSQPLIAVTGTNGKTTTTTLIGDMLSASGQTVFVGGNIGAPLMGFVDQGAEAQVVVVEVSSFQLDTIVKFRPTVAVILNITEDHLARYDDFNGYVNSKGRILENQQESDVAVLNAADPWVQKAAQKAAGRKCYFGVDSEIGDGAVIGDGVVDIMSGGQRSTRLTIPSGTLSSRHNMENAAAASLAALAVGGEGQGVQAAINNFRGLPHRLEYVDRVDDVEYVDDSKATNPDAVKRALESFNRPVVLLMGGEDKGCDFGILKTVIREKVKVVVLLGAARERLKKSLNGDVSVVEADSMTAAVQCASGLAAPGEVVLLSPACASFDMYDSYAHRGRDFCRAVETIKRDRV